jgi:hypothetical protein
MDRRWRFQSKTHHSPASFPLTPSPTGALQLPFWNSSFFPFTALANDKILDVISSAVIFLLQQVIITSHLFPSAKFSLSRLQELSSLVGKDRLVVDVSCRRRADRWVVAMNKWQDLTDLDVTKESLEMLSEYCRSVHPSPLFGPLPLCSSFCVSSLSSPRKLSPSSRILGSDQDGLSYILLLFTFCFQRILDPRRRR